jgi:ABC-type amino acid transport substrate-binding protein
MTDSGQFVTLVPGQLTVCSYAGFAPYCFRASDGSVAGLDIEFLDRFAQSLGLRMAVLEKPFDQTWTAPGADLCDIAGATIMRLASRALGRASWSEPYYEVKRSLLVRASEKSRFVVPGGSPDAVIVVTRGATAEIDARQRYPHCRLRYVDEVAGHCPDVQKYIATTLLAEGHVDAFASAQAGNEFLVMAYGRLVPEGLAVADVHVAQALDDTFNFVVRDDSLGLHARLNRFIGERGSGYVPADWTALLALLQEPA